MECIADDAGHHDQEGEEAEQHVGGDAERINVDFGFGPELECGLDIGPKTFQCFHVLLFMSWTTRCRCSGG